MFLVPILLFVNGMLRLASLQGPLMKQWSPAKQVKFNALVFFLAVSNFITAILLIRDHSWVRSAIVVFSLLGVLTLIVSSKKSLGKSFPKGVFYPVLTFETMILLLLGISFLRH